jgi:exodeoxyribonuclease VII large subunit
LIVRDRADLLTAVDTTAHRAARAIRYVLATAARRLTDLGIARPASLLSRRIGRALQRVDEAEQSMAASLRSSIQIRLRQWHAADAALRARDVRIQLEAAKGRLNALQGRLEALSPLAVLDRGYAVVETGERRVVSDASSVAPGEDIRIRLARGRLAATVQKVETA